MAKIFISFVHDDRTVAETLKRIIEQELNLRGQVFMVTDQSQLLAGDDWLSRIREELSSADIIVLMMSKRSIKTPWVNFEAGAGWIMEKRLISACFGNQQKGELPKPYSNWHAVQLPYDKHYLLDSIADCLGIQKPPLRILETLEKIVGSEKKKEGFDAFVEMMVDLDFALKHWRDEP